MKDRLYNTLILLVTWLIVMLEPELEPETPYRCGGDQIRDEQWIDEAFAKAFDK
jgi:hypothetical protein